MPGENVAVLPTEEQLPTGLAAAGRPQAAAAAAAAADDDAEPDAPMPSADEAAGGEKAGSDPDEAPTAAAHKPKVSCLVC